MKKAQQIFGIIFLTALYCLSIGVWKPVSTFSSQDHENSYKQNRSLVVSTINEISFSENLAPFGTAKQNNNNENTGLNHFDFSPTNLTLINGYAFYLNDYILRWHNLLIQSKKEILLFPFHSFW